MKRILLDENIPITLADLAPVGFELHHVHGLGWDHMSDRELLENAEAAEFDIFLTADRSIAYQQNLRIQRVALVVLTNNNWPVIREQASAIFRAVLDAKVANVEVVTLPHRVGSRRRQPRRP